MHLSQSIALTSLKVENSFFKSYYSYQKPLNSCHKHSCSLQPILDHSSFAAPKHYLVMDPAELGNTNMAATDYGWRHFLSKEGRSSLFFEISDFNCSSEWHDSEATSSQLCYSQSTIHTAFVFV